MIRCTGLGGSGLWAILTWACLAHVGARRHMCKRTHTHNTCSHMHPSSSHNSQEPAKAEVAAVFERMKDNGVLMGKVCVFMTRYDSHYEIKYVNAQLCECVCVHVT